MKDIEKDIELRSEDFQEVLGSVPPWIQRWGITAIAIVVVLLLIGSAIFKYPDIISSSITLTGTSPAAGIVAKVPGKIQKLCVVDNQYVSIGDYLAIIENPAKTEDILYLKEYLTLINNNFDSISLLPRKNMNLGSTQSFYSSFYITLSDYFQFKEQAYYLKKIDFMKDRISRNEAYYNNMLRQRSLVNEQLSITYRQYVRDSTLNKKGILSNEEFEKSHNQYLQGHLSVENMHTTLENMQIQIAQMLESLLDTEYQYTDKKNTIETQLKSQITQLLTEIQTWELNCVLTASVAGNITFTNYWIENQNVIGGEVVFNIIPNDKGPVMGKALLPTTRSGKVKIGQKVNIRFSNFPDNEYGMVRGVVSNISLVPAKTKEVSNYIVEIKLPDGLRTTYKKELPFLPEMEGQAEIITDDLSLLERFILPIKRVLMENV